MSKRVSVREIVAAIEDLYVTEGQGTGWTASLETIRTAALLDMAKSLRRLVQLAECPNVAAGFRSMQQLATIERGRERRRRLKRKTVIR